MVDITWLNDLKAKVIEERDKTNFDDLIKCYQNDLLRAGFVMAWLMLVESLKRKIVTLADKDVKVAIEALTTITGTEEAMHSNDEVIWKGAAKCDLISKEDEGVIELLWKKRCLLSHPYMPEVSESDFRYMVENLVSMSLGRTLMWSKPMIEGYFADIKTNIFLIPDDLDEKNANADKVLSFIPDKLKPFFWKTLFYELSISLEEGHKKHRVMLRVLAIRFVRFSGIDINSPEFTLANQIKNYCHVCWYIFFSKWTWRMLNDEYQAQLFRFLKDNKKAAQKVLWLAKGLLEHEESIDKKYVDCYYEALSNYDVTEMQRYYLDKDRFLTILFKDKIEGYQFSEQGDFIDMISSMTQEDINSFSPEQLQQLGKYVEMCCINGTFKAQDYAMRHSIWSDNLNYAKGFVIEGLSNENGELYISKRHLEYVLPVLYHAKEKDQLEIIDALNQLPVVETMQEPMVSQTIRANIQKYFDITTEVGEAFITVVNKYCVS